MILLNYEKGYFKPALGSRVGQSTPFYKNMFYSWYVIEKCDAAEL